MTDYILSIDPGLSSGVALLAYEPGKAPWLEKVWQFGNGITGFREWTKVHYSAAWYDSEWGTEFAAVIKPTGRRFGHELFLDDETDVRYDEDTDEEVEVIRNRKNVTVIAEKFTARNTKGFSYTTASLEPLRVEGGLVWEGLMPDYAPSEKRWRDPTLQYLVGGKDLADKKKRRDRFLKESGFYVTPKELGAPDANDARSAISHGLNYLAREVKHKETWKLITDWTEQNG